MDAIQQEREMTMRTTFLALCLSAVFPQGVLAGPIGETSVAEGQLKGVVDGPVAKFLGVPYAAPPVGENRWRAPQPAASWSGVRAADHKSPACFQKVSERTPTVSEDCLYL